MFHSEHYRYSLTICTESVIRHVASLSSCLMIGSRPVTQLMPGASECAGKSIVVDYMCWRFHVSLINLSIYILLARLSHFLSRSVLVLAMMQLHMHRSEGFCCLCVCDLWHSHINLLFIEKILSVAARLARVCSRLFSAQLFERVLL